MEAQAQAGGRRWISSTRSAWRTTNSRWFPSHSQRERGRAGRRDRSAGSLALLLSVPNLRIEGGRWILGQGHRSRAAPARMTWRPRRRLHRACSLALPTSGARWGQPVTGTAFTMRINLKIVQGRAAVRHRAAPASSCATSLGRRGVLTGGGPCLLRPRLGENRAQPAFIGSQKLPAPQRCAP